MAKKRAVKAAVKATVKATVGATEAPTTAEPAKPEAKQPSISDPLDTAVVEMLNDLTPRWQSFASDSLSEAKRIAMIRLVVSGFAKTKLAYKITNSATGEWIRLRYILSGQFVGKPLVQYFAAQCPRDWFAADTLQEMPGIRTATEPNEWILAITDAGDQLRRGPDRDLWLRFINECNAPPMILKDGSEFGRDALPLGIKANSNPVVTLGDHPQIVIDNDNAIALDYEAAVYLKALIDCGDWMSGPKFNQKHPELGGNVRVDRLEIPAVVRKRVDSQTGKGSRWLT